MASNSPLRLNEQEVIESYLKLESMPQTAKEFNCSVTSIARILRKNNIAKENPFGKLELNEQEVIESYDLYSSVGVTAKKFKCCRNTIVRILKKNGIFISRPPSSHLSPYQLKTMALTER